MPAGGSFQTSVNGHAHEDNSRRFTFHPPALDPAPALALPRGPGARAGARAGIEIAFLLGGNAAIWRGFAFPTRVADIMRDLTTLCTDGVRNTRVKPGPRARLLQHGADVAQNRVGIGELAGGLLRVDVATVHTHLEDAARGGDELERPDLELETQQLRRQTAGMGFVVSGRAVFDDDFRLHCVWAKDGRKNPTCSLPIPTVPESRREMRPGQGGPLSSRQFSLCVQGLDAERDPRFLCSARLDPVRVAS